MEYIQGWLLNNYGKWAQRMHLLIAVITLLKILESARVRVYDIYPASFHWPLHILEDLSFKELKPEFSLIWEPLALLLSQMISFKQRKECARDLKIVKLKKRQWNQSGLSLSLNLFHSTRYYMFHDSIFYMLNIHNLYGLRFELYGFHV